MAYLNDCKFIGNLGGDPSYRMAGDKPVCDFSVALTKRRTGPDGTPKEYTVWVKCVCWKRLADLARDLLRKGSKVFVSGEFQINEFEGRDGPVKSPEFVLTDFQLLSAHPNQQGGAGPGYGQGQQGGRGRQGGGNRGGGAGYGGGQGGFGAGQGGDPGFSGYEQAGPGFP